MPSSRGASGLRDRTRSPALAGGFVFSLTAEPLENPGREGGGGGLAGLKEAVWKLSTENEMFWSHALLSI